MTGDNSAVEQVRRYTDIVSLVEEYFPLRRSGMNYKALCPFHQEKTPSFTVSSDKQIFHCFGCGQSGDVFTFIMRMEGLDFPEALRRLAERSNVKLEYTESAKKQKKLSDEIYELNTRAASFYQKCLAGRIGSRAMEYLISRGITKDEIEKFSIGYAPAGSMLLKNAREKSVPLKLLETADLVSRNSSGDTYDKFRDRIIFPIHDSRGRIAGFGARSLDENTLPKYINTSQNAVFEKRKLLYGLYFSREEIRKKNRVVILEGYTDVIAAHRSGFGEAVASLGTSLTSEHVYSIRRLAGEAILAFDSDEAGAKATSRGLDAVLGSDMPARVMVLPEDSDPEDIIRKAPEKFALLLDSALPFIEWKLEYSLSSVSGIKDSSVRKSRTVREMVPVLSAVSDPVRRSDAVRLVSERLEVSESAVMQELKRHSRGAPSYVEETFEPERASRGEKIAREILHVLTIHPEFTGRVSGFIASESFDEPGFYSRMLKDYVEVYKSDIHKMMREQGDREKKALARLTVAGLSCDDPGEYIESLKENLERYILEKRYGRVALEMKKLIDLDKPVDEKIRKEFARLAKILKSTGGKTGVRY